MNKKRQFLELSAALLIFNLFLGGFALYSSWKGQIEIAKAKDFSDTTEVLGVNANVPKFDKNFIMSNQTFSSTRVFPNSESIQNYLDKINSPLKNYIIEGKPASHWIFSAARGTTSSKWGVVPTINPAVLLAYLEKEQSLVTLSSYDPYKDSSKRIKYAMGYACPDTGPCEEKYTGFINQINWGAYQLQFNYNNALSGKYVLPYKVSNTITTLDEYNVFLTNEATVANYRYTPHVYWGNYNLWKIITANGWGVDTSTYNMADIDKVNLAEKDKIIEASGGAKIEYSQVSGLLQKNCNLGESGENIKLLQRFLRQQGYFMNREITGICGTVTKRAVEIYNGKGGEYLDMPTVVKSKDIYANPRGITTSGLNLRTEACGDLKGTIPWGTKGTITSELISKSCLGGNWNWYKVKWQNGAEGWSVSSYLSENVVKITQESAVIKATQPTSISKPTTQESVGSTSGKNRKVVANSRGVKSKGLNLRSSACGTTKGTMSWGKSATIISGPVNKKCFGANIPWYQINYNGKTYWAAGNYLDLY